MSMSKNKSLYSFAEKKRIRKSFAKHYLNIDPPYLLDIQRKSFDDFLQLDIPHDQRKNIGLQKVFNDAFPISSSAGNIRLDFIRYNLTPSQYSVRDCILRAISYVAKLHAKIRLTIFNKDGDSKSIQHSVEEDVYFGEIPLMTDNCSFLINGNERVVVSQLHRSPGVYFEHDGGKTNASNKLIYHAKIVPYRGSWLDLEFDNKDLIYFRVDKRRKMNVTLLLKALGMTRGQILDLFYDKDTYVIENGKFYRQIDYDRIIGEITKFDILHPKSNELLLTKGKKITKRQIEEFKKLNITNIEVPQEEMYGKIVAKDIIDMDTGEVISQSNQVLDEQLIKEILLLSINQISILNVNDIDNGSYIADTLREEEHSRETASSKTEAIHQIYRMMRPGEPYTEEIAQSIFNRMFFSLESYDLSQVGRFKFNSRTYQQNHEYVNQKTWFGQLITEYKNKSHEEMILTKEDIIIALAVLIELRNGKNHADDIDSLANRRVRMVGELIDNQFRSGLFKVERAIKEKISQHDDKASLVPSKVIVTKPIVSSIKDFFALSQLSQFMDQTNPLSEITHKRRISALGPGGLSRDRAGFEVRDVHVTHYGRLCPIETPEGQNIGLINSLALYTKPNFHGFLEAPYFKVQNGVVIKEISYLSAIDEHKYIIAPASVKLDQNMQIIDEKVIARKMGETVIVLSTEIDYIDIMPQQFLSVAAALIPFLEHDDANRALMGSNMQRQGVPCFKASKPLVGTGMERYVARDSGSMIINKHSGVVEYVDGQTIIVRSVNNDGLSDKIEAYKPNKYLRTNQNTSLCQRPIVKIGDVVEAGDVIADGASTDLGELAVGQNIVVAFMSWNGYNFEDSILVSEKLVASDKYTSLHIEEFEVLSRETKQGDEEITADIPNVSQRALANLDEFGIINIGTKVTEGDILVGKITPKGEVNLSPEEKLLKAIFGEKSSDVRDSSLRVPLGVNGVVVGVEIFHRDGIKSSRNKQIIDDQVKQLSQSFNNEINLITDIVNNKIIELATGCAENSRRKDAKSALSKNDLLDIIQKNGNLFTLSVKNKAINQKIVALQDVAIEKINSLKEELEIKRKQIIAPAELGNGVIEMVKVFVAIKRRLQAGDKLAGRHGNKGVVSKILPVEDMPYLADGTPVDMILNPLGVPSRMNIGQVLEVHLGLASLGLGKKINEMLVRKKQASELREFLTKIYQAGENKLANYSLDAFNDDEIMELAHNLSNGVPFATPVFDGANEKEIKELLKLADLPQSGQLDMYDGRTGEKFDRAITVGYMYILRLHHLVDEKLHARSTGPYSLVTQQPLGGRSQFGGQRFGEMEVWALEAYGAAHLLQEVLTIRSDDYEGRNKTYEMILSGQSDSYSGRPEAFEVLLSEIKALGFDIGVK